MGLAHSLALVGRAILGETGSADDHQQRDAGAYEVLGLMGRGGCKRHKAFLAPKSISSDGIGGTKQAETR